MHKIVNAAQSQFEISRKRVGLIAAAFVLVAAGVGNAEDFLSQARQLASSGKTREAIGAYQQALNQLVLRDQRQSMLDEVGQLYYSEKQWGKAVQVWEELAKTYPNDSLAAKALWRVATTHSGPLNDRLASIKTMQNLYQRFPRSEYGERARYAEAVLYVWEGQKSKAKNVFDRYLAEYPDGKYAKAAQTFLSSVK